MFLLLWSIWYSFWWSFLQVGLSTGRSGSGLCPTGNRPDGIGFWENSLAAYRRSKRVRQIRLQRVLERVGQRKKYEKTAKNGEETARKTQIRRKSHWNLWDFVRFGFNLIRFDEISLDSVKISLDLHEVALESGFFNRNLEFSCRNLRFRRIMGFSPVGSGFRVFGGEKPKLIHRSRFLVEKIRRRPPE